MADPLTGMPQGQSPINALQLPKIQLPQAPAQAPEANFQNIYKMLSTPQPSMVENVMPYIAQTLKSPTAGLEASIAQNVAAAQSDALKRGLTGSDIEAAGMQGARIAGAQQIADMNAQIANQMASYIMQAYNMDITANREMFQNIAQAIGQKMALDTEMQMFIAAGETQRALAAAAGKSQLWGAGIQAAGMLAAGALAGGVGGAAGMALAGGALAGGTAGAAAVRK